jgi:protein TonB
MTRLQKKCLFAATGAHVLVLVVLLCSGFISTTPKVDNSQVLDVIPDVLVDVALSSGVKNPTPPTPQPQPNPPPQPVTQPQPPPQPQPLPKPPEPVKQVEPVKTPDEVKPMDKPDIEIPKPPPKKKEIKVDLTPATRDAKKAADDAAKAEAAAQAKAKLEAQKRAQAIKTAMRDIQKNASSSTEVKMTGTSSVSYANYAAAVKKAYDDAWTTPEDMTTDDANIKVSVTISRDGHVISSHITDPSGESRLDASVQHALDRVDFVAPFPDGATETERTFIITFNPQAKNSNG